MKKIIFTVTLFIFIVSACAASEDAIPSVTSLPTTSNSVNTPVQPTTTIEPSPTPTLVPLGGGGKFIMHINPLLVPEEFSPQKPYAWFSASSDGTNLKHLDYNIWSISPDGKRALVYNQVGVVFLINLDDDSEIMLDDSLFYYFIPRSSVDSQTAFWLPNGDAVVLAGEKANSGKLFVHIVGKDGAMRKLEKPTQIMRKYAAFLFSSPDGKYLYWKNCATISCPQYYVTATDDSEQKQILGSLADVQEMHFSPSGQYATYITSTPVESCFIYNIADGTSTQLLPGENHGLDFCSGGSHWSPNEDKLFGRTKTGFSIFSAPDDEIIKTIPFSEVNVGTCYVANWMPNGDGIFLSTCIDKDNLDGRNLMGGTNNVRLYMRDYVQSIGARLIDISSGKVTEYLDAGFCNAIVSPDSKWILFYQCKGENNLAVNPSQLLNLETQEMTPVFQEFVSDSMEIYSRSSMDVDQSWLVFWLP